MKKNPIDTMIKAKAVLAPMSGITDIPFRLMCRKFGCKFAFTEMVDVNGIVYKNKKTLTYLDRVPKDEPLGVQIVGADADRLLFAAQLCEEKGFEVLDINAGCPARKVIKGGKGAALLKDVPKFADIVSRIVKKLTIPVTVKIRSGWSEDSLNYMEVAKAVESEGAAAICIHTRTQEQMYKGQADHGITAKLKKKIKIPVFASGNIFTAGDAKKVLEETGCDGVFVARGALGKPWIFRATEDILSGKDKFDAPGFSDIKKIMIEQFSLSVKFQGEFVARKRMYKHVTWYLKRFKNMNEIMKAYSKVEDLASFESFIGSIEMDDKNHLYLAK
ncbi:tRNA dihydrouridine synthase DusB [Candidatus Omnitrophota bacterium]